MPLAATTEMLKKAQQGRYAIGAFNVENMEMVQAVIQAAEEMAAPVILQTTSGTLNYAPPEVYCANVAAIAASADIPVAIHLDHGSSLAAAAKALRAGYTSVMIDGSKLPLEENIALTRSVAAFCRPCGVPVEGELGQVGGKEDDTESAGSGYTDPDEAVRFAEETGVSSLAVGVGTAHGVYKKTPVLNVELIGRLRQLLSVPMVLHGASGLSDEAVKSCIAQGICKVNFATELRMAYTQAVRRILEDAAAFDPKKYGAAGRDAVKKRVMDRIAVCGCGGKA